MNKLFTILGGKFKFSAQDSDSEYLFWQRKNSPVSSNLKPPLARRESTPGRIWEFKKDDREKNIHFITNSTPGLEKLTLAL